MTQVDPGVKALWDAVIRQARNDFRAAPTKRPPPWRVDATHIKSPKKKSTTTKKTTKTKGMKRKATRRRCPCVSCGAQRLRGYRDALREADRAARFLWTRTDEVVHLAHLAVGKRVEWLRERVPHDTRVKWAAIQQELAWVHDELAVLAKLQEMRDDQTRSSKAKGNNRIAEHISRDVETHDGAGGGLEGQDQ